MSHDLRLGLADSFQAYQLNPVTLYTGFPPAVSRASEHEMATLSLATLNHQTSVVIVQYLTC